MGLPAAGAGCWRRQREDQIMTFAIVTLAVVTMVLAVELAFIARA
jgi:hypothetical protein